jgi:hypothetical protein
VATTGQASALVAAGADVVRGGRSGRWRQEQVSSAAAGAGCGVLETYLSSIDQVSEFILFVFIAVFS